jgi:hypothetical protein
MTAERYAEVFRRYKRAQLVCALARSLGRHDAADKVGRYAMRLRRVLGTGANLRRVVASGRVR